MTDAEKVAMVAQIIATFTDNANDDDGDKYLSDSNLAIDAIENIIVHDDDSMARRDGWI